MPRFAANLSMLFCEVPFLDRFERAAEAGFAAVEFQFPYACEVDAIAAKLAAAGLPAVLHNLPAGDIALGERGIACDPRRVDEFRTGVDAAVRYASALGVRQLNCLAGLAPAHIDAAILRSTLVDNLRHAAAVLRAHGIRLLVEPINTFDLPGFFLSTPVQAIELLDAVGDDNVSLQYDVYHAHRMGDAVLDTLERLLPRIAHVQIADHPGRHEPGTGAIDFPAVFAMLDRIGYHGWVGCEYVPLGTTDDGLAWRDSLVGPY